MATCSSIIITKPSSSEEMSLMTIEYDFIGTVLLYEMRNGKYSSRNLYGYEDAAGSQLRYTVLLPPNLAHCIVCKRT